MKASEDIDFVDNTYVTNRAQARAAGLLVGAYHFAQPSTGVNDAIAEADHFVDTAQPVSGDLIPVLDLERSGSLSQVALTTWVQAFLGRVYERVGVHAAIYVSPNFWRTYMGDTTWFALNGYDILWVAHWTTGVAPSVPGANWAGDGWTFWQYTSDGVVPGITGRVDLNRYHSQGLQAGPHPVASAASSRGHENARRNRRSLDVPITVNNDQITRCSKLLRASLLYRREVAHGMSRSGSGVTGA